MLRMFVRVRSSTLSILIATFAVAMADLLPAQTAWAGDRVDFARDIRPILSDACFQCHGPDESQRKSDLRLDTRDGVFRELNGAIPIVPGKPGESELYRRIASDDPDELMPPPKSKKTLSPKQKELVRNWIEQGANWNSHWAFNSPQRPEVPKPGNASWVRNPIDAFILSRLERE